MKKKNFFIVLIIILAILGGFWLGTAYKAPTKDKDKDQVLAKIKSNGKIIIGTTGLFEPMSFYDADKNLVGFDIDIAREIAMSLGVDVEFKIGDFTELLNEVKEGKIDALINAVTITDERSKIYAFSDPYFNNGQGLIVRKENTDINSEQDLAGKRIGVWRNTTCEIEANKYVGNGEVIPYDNREEIEALKKGEVDVVVMDQLNAMMIADRNPNLKSVGDMFSDEYYGVVLNREGTGLVSQVNKTMKELKRNGKLDEFERRWILQ